MKNCIRFIAGSALIAVLAFTGCSAETKTEIANLTQEQMVSQLDEPSKDAVFEAVLAGKNADALLAKLSNEQKAALFDRMLTDETKAEIFDELLTDEKKNEIYAEKLTDEEKGKIFDAILADKRTSETFLALLTDEEKEAVYNEKLTDEEKSKIFDKILTDKRTSDTLLELLTDEEKEAVYNEKLTDEEKTKIFGELLNKIRTEKELVEYFTDEEKAAIFDAVLNTKTGTEFVVEIIGKLEEEGNGELYSQIRQFFLDLEATDKTAPGEVTNLKATEAPYAVKLTWTDGLNRNNDLYGYLVSWTGVSNSRAVVMLEKNSMMVPQSLKGDKSNGITITDLIGGTKYRFTVQAVDLIGNKSTGVTVEATPKATSVVAQEALAAGTYTIYHLQQKTTGEKNAGDYDLFEKFETTVEANSTLNDLKKDYPGFTAMTVTQNGNAIYVFYDRNLITYTFNTGDEGAFKDGSKSRTVSGLYGAKYRIERPKYNNPTEKELKEWKSGEYSAEKTFDSEDHTFEPVWADYGTVAPEGFVVVDGVSIEGTETWKPKSYVFVSGRALEIRDLFACDHEVTRGEFKAVMGTDPSTAKAYDKDGTELTGDDVLTNPVNYVNWYAAIAYCNKLSIKENLSPCYSVEGVTDWANLAYDAIPTYSSASSLRDKWNAATCNFDANGYRLPTEAEWEWLARGGDDHTTYAGSDNLNDVAWHRCDTVSTGSREVKTKAPNGYGLYDMSGNIHEWCWDWKADSITSETPEFGPASGFYRVMRGYSWSHADKYSFAITGRNSIVAAYTRENNFGFRVVRTGTILK